MLQEVLSFSIILGGARILRSSGLEKKLHHDHGKASLLPVPSKNIREGRAAAWQKCVLCANTLNIEEGRREAIQRLTCGAVFHRLLSSPAKSTFSHKKRANKLKRIYRTE